jgi:hypothetical protein
MATQRAIFVLLGTSSLLLSCLSIYLLGGREPAKLIASLSARADRCLQLSIPPQDFATAVPDPETVSGDATAAFFIIGLSFLYLHSTGPHQSVAICRWAEIGFTIAIHIRL